jgi:hypothetical protein
LVSLTTLFTLAVIIAAGLFLRTQAFLGTEVVEPLQDDAAEAYALAQVLERQGAYQALTDPFAEDAQGETGEIFGSLGYPLFLSLFVDADATDGSLSAAVIAQVVLGALAILLAFMLTTRLLDPHWGLTVALLTAVSPYLVNISLYLVGATLLMVVLLVYLVTAARIGERGAVVRTFFAAALLGVVSWVDGTFQFLILPWVILLFFASKGLSRFMTPVAAALGFILVFGPLMALNQAAVDTAVPMESMAMSIQQGMQPPAEASAGTSTEAADEADLLTALGALGAGFIDDPRGVLSWYFVEKPQTLWSLGGQPEVEQTFVYEVAETPYAQNPLFLASEQLMQLLHGPVVLIALFGVILVWLPFAGKRLGAAQLIGLRTVSMVLIYATLAHLFGAAAPQYSTPLMPLVFLMAVTPLYLLTLPRPQRVTPAKAAPESAEAQPVAEPEAA